MNLTEIYQKILSQMNEALSLEIPESKPYNTWVSLINYTNNEQKNNTGIKKLFAKLLTRDGYQFYTSDIFIGVYRIFYELGPEYIDCTEMSVYKEEHALNVIQFFLINSSNTEFIKKLLSHYPKHNYTTPVSGESYYQGMDVVYLCLRYSSLSIFELLLKNAELPLNTLDPCRAIEYAYQNHRGYTTILPYLWKAFKTFQYKDSTLNFLQFVILISEYYNKEKSKEFILNTFNSHIDELLSIIPDGTYKGLTAFHLAIKNGNKKFAIRIYELVGKDIADILYKGLNLKEFIDKYGSPTLNSELFRLFPSILTITTQTKPSPSLLESEQIDTPKNLSEMITKTTPKMIIDPKYLGYRYPSLPWLISSKDAKQTTHDDVFNNPDATKITFRLLRDFEQSRSRLPSTSQFGMAEVEADEPNMDEVEEKLYFYFKAEKLKPIDHSHKLFVVFAGRKEKASLPELAEKDIARCLIVLTEEEYRDLNIADRVELKNRYDFLITQPRKKLADHTFSDPGKLTERRRAALKFCLEKTIQHVVFMDDNIQNIALINQTTRNHSGIEDLFDYMVAEMNETKNIFVSIPTYSPLHRKPVSKMLGCKAWALNIGTIQKLLPGKAIEFCFPDNETLWGEDYFLQVLLWRLSPPNIMGYSVLPHADVQLIRTSAHKSANARSGMRVRKYNIKDVIPDPYEFSKEDPKNQYIISCIDAAITEFNRLIDEEIARHQKKIQLIQNYKPKYKSASSHASVSSVSLYPHQNNAIQFHKARSMEMDLTFDLATGTGKSL